MYRFLAQLLEPYTVLSLLVAVGLVNLWRKGEGGRGRLLLPTLPFALLMTLSLPWAGYLALGSLEWQYPPLERRPAGTEAIVVLGGGITPPDGVNRRAELNPDSVYRCLHAAALYRQGAACPVLVSGGKAEPCAPALAVAMRALLEELGVDPSDITEEGSILNTYENYLMASELLRRWGVRRVVLVTEATHMPRALRIFRRQGVVATPSACRYQATSHAFTAEDLLPDVRAVVRCQNALYEWVGAAWYWLRGRV